MNKEKQEFGVSAAFVASLYGPDFSVKSFCEAIPHIRALGFSAFQPEVGRKETLPEWRGGGARVVERAAREAGLRATQFVAHFMGEFFSTPENIASRAGLEELRQAVGCSEAFDGCLTLTIPAWRLKIDWRRYPDADGAWVEDLMKRRTEKLLDFLELVDRGGRLLAIEVLPLSVFGGSRRFLDVCDELGSGRSGINLDTANAWASGEIVPLLPFEIRGRIFGTHLSDINSTENRKRPPGEGSIERKPPLKNLRAVGYAGSLDIEIDCPPERVFAEYNSGLKYLISQGA